jgi:uncharacterized membrane protein YeaQ/YmgE (transglycosylase-associated protein family)
MDLIIWIVVGAIGGFLASLFVKLAWGGLIGSIVTGIVGGLLAGWLAGLLGLNMQVSGFNLGSILTAFIGAIILSVVLGWISGRR